MYLGQKEHREHSPSFEEESKFAKHEYGSLLPRKEMKRRIIEFLTSKQSHMIISSIIFVFRDIVDLFWKLKKWIQHHLHFAEDRCPSWLPAKSRGWNEGRS